jgi:protein TonB
MIKESMLDRLAERPLREKRIRKYGLEAGLVLSLLAIVVLFTANFQFEDPDMVLTPAEQTSFEMEDILQTEQIIEQPPPPVALVPIEVPDEVIIEETFTFESELDLDAQLELTGPPRQAVPPPPKTVVEEVEEEEIEPEIFVVVEQMPEIIGGIQKVYEYLEYPEMARTANIEGQVIVQLVIETDGTPSSPEIIRSASEILDEAAIKAVMKLRFIPGRQRDQPVRVRYSIPIRFELRSQ